MKIWHLKFIFHFKCFEKIQIQTKTLIAFYQITIPIKIQTDSNLENIRYFNFFLIEFETKSTNIAHCAFTNFHFIPISKVLFYYRWDREKCKKLHGVLRPFTVCFWNRGIPQKVYPTFDNIFNVPMKRLQKWY